MYESENQTGMNSDNISGNDVTSNFEGIQGQVLQPVYLVQPVNPAQQVQGQGQILQPVYLVQQAVQGQVQQPLSQATPIPSPAQQVSQPAAGNGSQEEKNLKFDEHKYGKFMDVVGSLARGEPPEMSNVVELMGGIDTQFWKGSIIGAATVFAMNNEAVKGMAANGIAKMMNLFGKSA